ncbi:MAG TPA: glycoside hydrolase family 18 protein [Candidatus Limnocylindrales bacterium]|nr:glycoside hydrolase family 18 protein [Candidatus Limnocylindrales bacterium]
MARPARRLAQRSGRQIAALGIAIVALVGTVLFMSHDAGGGRPADASLPGFGAVGTDGTATLPSAAPVPGHEMYGFIPYWEMDSTIAAHAVDVDLTTVALFSVTQRANGSLATSAIGYRRITGPIGRRIIADAHRAHRRVEITFTSFGRAKNAAFFGSPAAQDAAIAALVRLRGTLGVDGVAVDVEDIADGDIPGYGAFVGRLRSALVRDLATATVTATTSAGPQGAALAVAANLAGADRIFLMAYDYRTGSDAPGGLAPLARTDGDVHTIGWSLDAYAAAGIPAGRLILGLPLYGLAWPVSSADLGAPATGTGTVWLPRQNLAALDAAPGPPVVDPVEQVAFLAVPRGSGWTAVYYDTPETLAAKLAVANARRLAGGGLWAVGYDRGVTGYATAVAAFRAGAGDPGAGASSSSTAPSRTPGSSESGVGRLRPGHHARSARPRVPRRRRPRHRSPGRGTRSTERAAGNRAGRRRGDCRRS